MGTGPDRVAGAKSGYLLVIVAVAVSIAIYASSLGNGFVYDDVIFIVKNELIKDVSNIPSFLFSDKSVSMEGDSNYYRPLSLLVAMADYHIFGLVPFGFHLTYLLMHAAATAAFFFFARGVFAGSDFAGVPSAPAPHQAARWGAFVAALLFAAHPVNTEVVAWNGAGDMMMTAFMLISLNCYMAGRHGPGALFFFLSAMGKETAMVLPFLVVALDLVLDRRSLLPLTRESAGEAVKRYLPYAAAGTLYMVLRTFAIGGFAGTDLHPELTRYESFINVAPLFAEYLWLLAVPLKLTVAHTFEPVRSAFEWKSIAASIVSALFVAALYVSYGRARGVFFSLLLIVLPLLPVFYIPALGMHAVAERRLYLPSAGFAMLFVFIAVAVSSRMSSLFAAPALRKWRGAVAAVVAATIVLYIYGTCVRIPVWKSELALWTDAVKKSPEDTYAFNNLAVALKAYGRLEEAEAMLKRALAIDPANDRALLNYGNIYLLKGRVDRAISFYEEARRVAPLEARTHYSLGRVYLENGRFAEAVDPLLEAVRLGSKSAVVSGALARAYFGVGRTEEAIGEYLKAIELGGNNGEAHNNLAAVYYRLGRYEEAIRWYEAAIRVDEGYMEARSNLATVHAVTGKLDLALRGFKKVLEARPDSPDAHHDLVRVYAMKGLYDEARREMAEVLRLDPDWPVSDEMAPLLILD